MNLVAKPRRSVSDISKEIARWEGTQRRLVWSKGGANRDIEAILGDLYTERAKAKVEGAHAASLRARKRVSRGGRGVHGRHMREVID